MSIERPAAAAPAHGAPDPEARYGRLQRPVKAVVAPLFRVCWPMHVEGLEHVPATGGAIVCANHISVLDSFFLPAVLPRRITFVGKAEYLDDWKTRRLFPALGMIPIDRSGGDASQAALDLAARLLERGELFGIYPEGTRSRDGLLHKGRTGPARLALRCGVPIVPVGIAGTDAIMPPDTARPRLRKPATIRFGEALRPEAYGGDDLVAAAGDRAVLRRMTDDLMAAICTLSGQRYVHEYATSAGAVTLVPPPGTGS